MTVKQMIRDAFDTVTCSDTLKKQTCDYVAGRMRRGRKSAARKLKWAVSMACLLLFATSGLGGLRPVSYTHLDVYKRQLPDRGVQSGRFQSASHPNHFYIR